ncbi:MAG: glutamate--tRNA ligase, partial [Chloroflexota bacterium]
MSDLHTRVRFAPSPTGFLHVGGARTALYNYLYARHTGGSFNLRIEDTDRTRYHADSLDDHLKGLRWLGLNWDEGPDVGGDYGPYLQSQRLELYHKFAEQLVREGKAYYCFCSAERLTLMREEQQKKGLFVGYDRRCRQLTSKQVADSRSQGIVPVVRLKAPLDGTTSFHDSIRGDISVDNSTLDDMVLLKSDGFPTYHLAAVVDDHLMKISHILRGDEWLTSVPKRIVLYDALGWDPPIYVHLPTILDPSGKGKLSKRKKHAPGEKEYPVFIHEFRKLGYLPEAMVNFLARVGWSYDDKTELMSREELIERFDLAGISKAPAVFSYEKLAWMNGVYIRQLERDDLAQRLLPFLKEAGWEPDLPLVRRLVLLIQERIKELGEAPSHLDFFFEEISYEPGLLVQKKMDRDSTAQALVAAEEALTRCMVFDEEELETILRPLAKELGL